MIERPPCLQPLNMFCSVFCFLRVLLQKQACLAVACLCRQHSLCCGCSHQHTFSHACVVLASESATHAAGEFVLRLCSGPGGGLGATSVIRRAMHFLHAHSDSYVDTSTGLSVSLTPSALSASCNTWTPTALPAVVIAPAAGLVGCCHPSSPSTSQWRPALQLQRACLQCCVVRQLAQCA